MRNLFNFFQNLGFHWRHATFKNVVVDPQNEKLILIAHRGQILKKNRFCPHQGAPMEKYSWIEKEELVCAWHGCRFKLNS
jgi:nitrite reductase/ring-hydroxylating ferredoxin subunit